MVYFVGRAFASGTISALSGEKGESTNRRMATSRSKESTIFRCFGYFRAYEPGSFFQCSSAT
jgi:hypothetical protein